MAGNLGSIVLAALGISFLIFIHELGHFLAARMFKVRVETFSLGFGPRIWGFRRGETDYRVSAVPLGGYVKMAGEYGDLRDSTVLAADDLTAKPPWQRAIIFSGGVIMNVIFAFLVFPLVFALGVPFPAPVLGGVQPGGPAWRAGLRQGDEVLTVDGHRVYQFADIGLNLALSDPEHVELRIRRGGEEQDVVVHGERSPTGELWRAGIGQLSEPLLAVEPDGPAVRAGLREHDELVAIDGVPLCANCTPDEALDRAFEAGRPVRLTVRRAGQSQTVDATIDPVRIVDEKDRLLGLIPADTTVLALRGPPEQFGYPLAVNDVILDVGGVSVSRSDKATEAISGGPPGELHLHIRRDGREQDVTLSAADRALFADGVALGPDTSTRIRVISESALAAAGVRDGDTIVALNGTPVHDYAELHDRAKSEGPRLHVDWRLPSGGLRGADVETRPHVAWNYGVLTLVREVRHQESLAGSLRAGWDTSLNMLRTTWLQLEKLVTGEVAAKNLGGIVQISYVTYQFANSGFSRLLFFLGLLSINLAVINVLPVPVLDGGQLLFLLLEKIRGRRLSERFLNAAQLAGLVAIVALVLYVTYNDISKMVG
jgi:regulator of sigma E protease